MKNEWKVVVAVLAVLVAAELTFRPFQDRLSKNLSHIRTIPSISESLQAQDGTSLLLLGNSYTRRDVHADVVEKALRDQDLDEPRVVKVRPDATAVLEWYYLFKTHFVEPERIPDVVVIGFTAANHLSDERPIEVQLLSGRFCRAHHIPEVFKQDVTSFGDRLTFLLSHASAMMSNQEHIRRRALDKVIPHYRYGVRHVNDVLRKQGQAPPDEVPHTRLARFLDLLKGTGTRVVFVVMPSPDRPEPHPEALSMIHEAGIDVLDCRHVPGIRAEDFEDIFYLKPDAGRRYSAYFGQKLADLLKADIPADH